MKVMEEIAFRATLQMQGIATMGADPAWDNRVSTYLRLQALMHAECDFGLVARANEEHEREELRQEIAHGSRWHSELAARAACQAAYDAADAASKEWSRRYCTPYWQAARDLALTPAPTLAAALFKVQVIRFDELDNDGGMTGDPMTLVAEDMARLQSHGTSPIDSYWQAFDTYNAGLMTEDEYFRAFEAMWSWAPPTPNDFLRKFEAAYSLGGCPTEENQERLLKEAAALLGHPARGG